MIPEHELDRLEALCKAATEGPWVCDEHGYYLDVGREVRDLIEAMPALIAEVRRLRALVAEYDALFDAEADVLNKLVKP